MNASGVPSVRANLLWLMMAGGGERGGGKESGGVSAAKGLFFSLIANYFKF